MKHLSGMDAMFLHMESAEMPTHIGSLHVLQLPEGYDGDFYEEVKTYLAGRLHLTSVFTRKLAFMPFDLSDPVWVEDENLDLEHHIRHITLPKPGSNRQLQQVIGRRHSNLLDRSRPLWEITVIDGLRSGEVALYAKVHHANVDGQAGIELVRALFDDVPSGRKIPPAQPKLRRNTYQLGVAELAGAAVRNAGRQYIKLARMVPDMLRAGRSVLPVVGDASLRNWRNLDPRKLLAPRTPLNVAITNQRSFAGRTVPLAEIKEMARALDVSFNDVVMATVSGALRRYLKASGELPERALTAAAPVSLRSPGDDTANNQVSMLMVDLATDEADPLDRLRRINASSTQRKAAMNKFRSAIPMDFPIFAAPWLLSGMAAMYGRSRLANWMPPPANLVISNVTGIPMQLYFAGAKVLCYYPVSIPSHGMALNVTVTSYHDRLDYGLIACRRALPDLNDLGDQLLGEHRRLLELARSRASTAGEGKKAGASAEAKSKAPTKASPAAKPAKPAKPASPAKALPKPQPASKPLRKANGAAPTPPVTAEQQ
ncbi:WS/DGAT/MGAT family O-acyltransferase, partial [Pseudomonas citronellolis]|uniref:WS/DGAT/MGAT family O-acyltransferase n=1 Tax=Pseudomonas citronellolis TaxID=53408 RepID=UPI0023E3BA45